MSTTLITTPTFARHSPRPWDILESAGAGPLRPREDAPLPGAELHGRALGVVGFGRIGAAASSCSPS
jgi:D-3-phosphoglycerate dehydrogenase